jgi:hypothetical protein
VHYDTRITSNADRLVAAVAHMRDAVERLNQGPAEHRPADNGWTSAQVECRI